MSIGVPLKLLHESENHVVTIELKNGELYRGYLTAAEDNMNCRLDDVNVTARDGKLFTLDQVYVRGSQIKFVIVPDMLKNSPMFKRIQAQLKKGKGRGGATAPIPQPRGKGPMGKGKFVKKKKL